ncbi:DUF1642 domain-containing protein [Enterococcus sp. AZ112]|uniref:DUF1642 domain-containing protein n=1 Tax=Enterococcus sp. AZ112 TaxID=2774812 RepID=UPI003F21F933
MNKQELIEELECLGVPTDSYNYLRGANYAVEKAISLAKQLDEPKKVVVPPIIDKFIRENEDPIYEICAWSDHYGSDDRTCGDSKLSAVINWYVKNSNEFYQAVINGYEVEEEPLYYVKLPEIGYMRFGFCIPITESIDEAKKYTEQEIKAIDERYWPFAVKVEEE